MRAVCSWPGWQIAAHSWADWPEHVVIRLPFWDSTSLCTNTTLGVADVIFP